MYALFMVSAICTVNYRWKQELYDYAWCEAWLWVYAFALVLAFLPSVVRRIARPVFYIVAYSVTIADVYCFVKFESAINPSILMLVAETDPREASEFFTAYPKPPADFRKFYMEACYAYGQLLVGDKHIYAGEVRW